MAHITRRIPHRPKTWICTCKAEWGGDCKTCPVVRSRQNLRRKRARQAKRGGGK